MAKIALVRIGALKNALSTLLQMPVQNVTAYATQLALDYLIQMRLYLTVSQQKLMLSRRKLECATLRFTLMTISATLSRTRWLQLRLHREFGIKFTLAPLILALANVLATLRQKK